MGDDKSLYEQCMSSGGVEGLADDAALEQIGRLVNLSGDLQINAGARRALQWSAALEKRGVSEPTLAILNYFRANAWGVRAKIKNSDRAQRIKWEQRELAEEILCLRKALNSLAFDNLHWFHRCQILTNLGNQMDAVGRFVEALEYWDRAISINKNFWMAQGNRGYALMHYGNSAYDGGHRAALFHSAHIDLVAAVTIASHHMNLGDPNARAVFEERKKRLETHINVRELAKRIRLDGFSLGRSKQEQRYRQWCLSNRLFLNPINDIGVHSIAARDILTLPSFVAAIEEPPSLIGFFNQMKQEYVSARWLYYEGLNSAVPHFSDREVRLYNTYDYPSYSLAVEKIKVAIRTTYSLLDKIAFFLNKYMNLGESAGDVSFSRIWFAKGNRGNGIRNELEKSENWPFRGLFWLSKDVTDKDFKDSTEPDARELHDIRVHLEHKYLKVHEMLVQRPTDPKSPLSWMIDDLALSITRTELKAKGLRVLKLVRAALTYLSLGMNWEERRRAAQSGEAVIAPMALNTWEDEWKI